MAFDPRNPFPQYPAVAPPQINTGMMSPYPGAPPAAQAPTPGWGAPLVQKGPMSGMLEGNTGYDDEAQLRRRDPQRALWAGTLMDIAGLIANPWNWQPSGMGLSAMAQAEEYNLRLEQQAEAKKQAQFVRDRQGIPNQYKDYPEEYQLWVLTGAKDRGISFEHFMLQSLQTKGPLPASGIQYQDRYDKLMAEGKIEEAQMLLRFASGAMSPDEKLLAALLQNPDMVDRISGYRGSIAGAEKEAVLSVEGYNQLTQVAPSLDLQIERLEEVLDIVKNAPETWQGSEYQAAVDPALQELRALLTEELFSKVAATKAMGVTYGNMTIAEWKILADTVANLTNRKDANIKIVERQLKRLSRARESVTKRIDEWDIDQYKLPRKDQVTPPGADLDESNLEPVNYGG